MTSKRLGLMLACTLLVGCDASGGYKAVSGSVTFQGKPLETGTIQFYTAGDQPTPVGGAMISHGRYELPREHGLKPGEYRVRISSTERVDNPSGAVSLEGPFRTVERIPSKYNTESTLTATVKAGESPTFDFNLE